MSLKDLAAIRSENVRRCAEHIRLGHSDAALRIMGYASGCILDARRFIDGDKGPYGEQNHPLRMTRPGDVEHEV